MKNAEIMREQISVDMFERLVSILDPSMDNYLYLYDLKGDFYYISESATMRFDIPINKFKDVVDNLQKFIYPGDFKLVQEDVEEIMTNKDKNFHNLQYRWLDKSGEAVWINCRGSVLRNADGEPEFLVGCINEIGNKQKADNVSGLLGEFSLQERLEQITSSGMECVVIRIGIDGFKDINENKGMDYGDMILRRTAECIKDAIIPGQELYKIVADEFVVLDFSKKGVDFATKLYRRIQRRISTFIEDNCYEVFYTVSAGVLDLKGMQSKSFVNVMKLSEYALNRAKEDGRNKCYVFEQKDYDAFLKRKDLLYIMRQAVNRDFADFEAYFQPIMDIKEKRLYSAETLLRFHPPELGMVSPVQFIPLLEESGLIIPVGRWVLNQAMAACSEIQKRIPEFKVSVNISYIQVLKGDVLKDIVEGLERYGLKSDSIIVELTESGFLESDENYIKFCEGMREHGIPLALDDFGTGYSNFHYLYDLKPSTIKIDRSFTLKALKNDYEYGLLQHMVDMTHSIELKMCIEGIETETELDKISKIGPDYIQGYYFGRPCNLQSFFEYIE